MKILAGLRKKIGKEEIREILLRLRSEGKTILLVSHNSEDINTLCDKIYDIDHGRLSEF